MNDVKVHYNSGKPAHLGASAYTQGTDIHVGPGQDRHLPHEAWHVVQQKQGRVKPTLQAKGLPVNADEGLEHEADAMGSRAASHNQPKVVNPQTATQGKSVGGSAPIQMVWKAKADNTYYEDSTYEKYDPAKGTHTSGRSTKKAPPPAALLAAFPALAGPPPPAGYRKITSATGSAWVNDKVASISSVGEEHLLMGGKHHHKSTKTRSWPIKADFYLHESDNSLFATSRDGRHTDGLPKYTVHKSGKTNDGVHIFT